MAEDVTFYADAQAESTLQMGPSGGQPFFVSNAAMVGVHLSNAFDTQGSKGSNFGRVKFLGVNLAEFVATWVVFPEDEAAFWRDIMPLARQKGKNGNSPPVDVVNPQVNRAGVKTCTIEDMTIDPPNARDGRTVILRMKEWSPAPTAPKPDSSAQGIQPGQSVLAGTEDNG